MTDPVASRDLRTPGDYLSGDDLIDREVVLTIAEAHWDPKVPDPITGEAVKKPVLLCEPRSKGKKPVRIVLNKGRRNQLINLFGEDFSSWPGKRITAYCDPKRAPNGSRMVAIKAAPSEAKQPDLTGRTGGPTTRSKSA